MVVSLSHRPAAWTRSGIDKVKVVDVAGAREVAFTVLREGGGHRDARDCDRCIVAASPSSVWDWAMVS